MAEIKIPFSAIRFSKKAVQEWGLNFARFVRKENENSIWNPVNPNISGDVNQWGVWEGLTNITPPLRLSFLPYLSAGVKTSPTNNGNVTEYPKSGGMDVKYGINESFTLDMTLVPDFAQVQSDNLYLNLTPFEVKFEDYRPFFTEGTELFSKAGLFYSRRVGAAPGGSAKLLNTYGAGNSGYKIEKNPGITRLYNATKFSGRTKGKLGIGIFNAVTAPMYARLNNLTTGIDSTILTEPLTNYNIIVFDQALKHRSSIAFTNTNVLRKGNSRNANVSSIDISLYDKKNLHNFTLTGRYSTIWGNQLHKNGFGTTTTFGKVSGLLQYSAALVLKSDKYDPNDLGYLQSNNSFTYNGAISFNFLKPTKRFLNHHYKFNVNNNYFGFFAQDDWRVRRNLTLNLGLRYEADTNVKNNSGYANINPLVASFYKGNRKADYNNFAPRIGFNLALFDDKLSFHGGYGIYYDRVTLELITLERGLDGRALPVQVRAGNALTAPNGQPIFLDANGRFVPGAPVFGNPFTGFILPGAGASGINIIDNNLQNPMIQQSNLGLQWGIARNYVIKVDYLHNFGTHFIIGRDVGVVNNPVVGGPDRVVNLESSVKFFYDGLLLSFEKRFANRFGFRAAYTLSKALNYANDDQIPFSNGPINSNNVQLEYGPTPTDQRHRFTLAGNVELPFGFRFSPIMTFASGVPMDIILPGGQSRIPVLQRNAGGRLFKTVGQLNTFLTAYNATLPVASRIPLAPLNAKFNDTFSSVDLRLSKTFSFKERLRLEPIVEVFNLFNTTNILGTSNTNYSGFGNVLGTSNFGQAITPAGGVFGSGGARAFQLAARFTF